MRALTVVVMLVAVAGLLAAGCGPKKEEVPQLQPPEPGMAPAVAPVAVPEKTAPVMTETMPPPPPVDRPGKAPKTAPEKSAPLAEGAQLYTVQKGDTLFAIARKFYGDGNLWHKIAVANKDKIKGKDQITIGMKLTIPAK